MRSPPTGDFHGYANGNKNADRYQKEPPDTATSS